MVEWFLLGALVGVLGTVAWLALRSGRRRTGTEVYAGSHQDTAAAAVEGDDPDAADASGPTDPAIAESGDVARADPDDPAALAHSVAPLIEGAGHPRDLAAHPAFAAAAAKLAAGDIGTHELLGYATGRSEALCYLSLEAVTRRNDAGDVIRPLLRLLPGGNGWRSWFALRALHVHATVPVIGAALVHLDGTWTYDPARGWFADFVGWRLDAGEQPGLTSALQYYETLTAEQRDGLDYVVSSLADVLPPGLADELESWKQVRIDVAYLNSVGHVWAERDDEAAAGIIAHPALDEAVTTLRAVVAADAPRRAVVIGEAGVGKSVVIVRLAQSLHREGWTVFRCSAGELLAGQIYIGQIEDRVATLMRSLENRRVVWIVPEFHELLHAGRTPQQPAGLLDHIHPYLERGGIRLVGETSLAAYEKLLHQRPRVRALLEAVRIEPLRPDAARAVTREWASGAGIPAAVLEEAHQLAAHHLSEQHAPGSVLTLLRRARELARTRSGADATPGRDELLQTLAAMTGLPLEILDDRVPLDLDAVRRFFAERVLGQDEAIDALVERLALIKAGLTDPSRPQGVFLFVGPTGTGKTEIAKALAEYLFGSADRMIRLDMSEFQEPGMVHRLLGVAEDVSAGGTLVEAVRRQPFCVVLFDELEKAEPRIWDVFLQLFDDGRLTDHGGTTASFRNAIVIMTSNVGAGAGGGGIGFTQPDGGGISRGVQHALAQTFRPEFINRIDRIVQFRPLPRSIMRRLLDKEIREVLGRRGLRDRPWAIEWEESAIELLISQGFSPTLGARPLKRAVERYLLAPLAVSIVGRELPEGDQFLYITAAGDRLKVDFIDPEGSAAALPGEEHQQTPALEDIVRDARGDAAEVDALRAEYEHIRDVLDGAAWQERKRKAFTTMSETEFWGSPARFGVLGLLEYMDRIEVGAETAGSLLQRVMRGVQHDGGRFPPQLVRRLARQVYLIGEALEGIAAGQPRDAFVRIVAADDPGVDAAAADDFARQLTGMYVAWAEQRGMRLQRVGEATAPFAATLAISGFAAYPILASEHGLHVLESPVQAQTKAFARSRVLVLVAAQPDEPPSARLTLRLQAEAALAGLDVQGLEVVRRYRGEPSPLVRDNVRGWRTGRLDLVLAGDFDVMG